MLCKNCGTLNDPNSNFCSSCGADLKLSDVGETPNTSESVYDTYNAVPPYPAQTPQDGKGFAIASLVLGIVSFFCFAFIAGTLGIVFGVAAKNKGYKGGMATAGIVCGAIGIVLWILMMIGGILFSIV